MIRRPPRSTRTDTSFPTRRSSDLQVADGRPAPTRRVAVRQQHDRGGIGSALRQGDRREQHETRDIGPGEEREGQRGGGAERRREEKDAARAEPVGKEGEDKQRNGVAELKAGGDRAGGGRREERKSTRQNTSHHW